MNISALPGIGGINFYPGKIPILYPVIMNLIRLCSGFYSHGNFEKSNGYFPCKLGLKNIPWPTSGIASN